MRAKQLVAALSCAALLLGAAACGGDSPKPPPLTSTPNTPSPTPTPTPTSGGLPDFTEWQDEPATLPPPQIPAVGKTHTKAGSVAFAKVYLEALNYAMLTSDAGPAKALSSASCSRCRMLESGFPNIVGNGNAYLGDPRYKPRYIASSDYSTESAGVGGEMLREPWTSKDSGSTKTMKQPREQIGIVLRLKWNAGRWQIVSFSANEH